MTTMKIDTEYPHDPVMVEYYPDDEVIILRIGEKSPGETRYARMNARQAAEIAFCLLKAAFRDTD